MKIEKGRKRSTSGRKGGPHQANKRKQSVAGTCVEQKRLVTKKPNGGGEGRTRLDQEKKGEEVAKGGKDGAFNFPFMGEVIEGRGMSRLWKKKKACSIGEKTGRGRRGGSIANKVSEAGSKGKERGGIIGPKRAKQGALKRPIRDVENKSR